MNKEASSVDRKHVYVEPKDLPSLSELNAIVRDVELRSSWYDRYGADWLQFAVAIIMMPSGLLLLRLDTWWSNVVGVFLLCCYHTCLTARAGHIAAHDAVADSSSVNYFVTVLFVEFIGSFSTKCGHDIHIKYHHPYTNIIGLGDSSTWKAPFLPCNIYMFIAPFLVPLLMPIISIYRLVSDGDWKYLAMYLTLFPAGIAFHVCLLMSVAGYSFLGALAIMWLYRGGLSVPYIHINIFQHIGLPMYSPDDRPARIYQMSTGCLNLSSNTLFNFVFGHSLISCHVEHHLFPRLSDNMCLKVKPYVSRYLKENGLPYHEVSYGDRLRVFLKNFDSLMIDAPDITHFMGLQ